MIDAESLYSTAQHIAAAQILSPFFLAPYSTTASRRFGSSSTTALRVLLFSLRHHPQHQVSQHTGIHIYTHSTHGGIEEHERDPACFGFFDALIVVMSRRSREMNFTYRANVCVCLCYMIWKEEKEGRDIE